MNTNNKLAEHKQPPSNMQPTSKQPKGNPDRCNPYKINCLQTKYMTTDQNHAARKMISSAFGLCKNPTENMKKYNRRCCRAAGPYIDKSWSSVWCNRMQTWYEHMGRHPLLWPAKTSGIQDAEWLKMRWLACGSRSIHHSLRANARESRSWKTGTPLA